MLRKQSTIWRFLLPIIVLQVSATVVFLNVFLAHRLNIADLLNMSEDGLFLVAAILINACILITVFLQLKKLIWGPIGGDPKTVIRLMDDIVNGRLDFGQLSAKPDTLLANTLAMRNTLRSHIDQLEDNASSLRLAANVFDHAQDGIFITDKAFKIVDVNESFTKITGYIKEAVLNHKPVELGFGFQDPEYFDKAEKSLKVKSTCRGEVWNLHADGNVYASWLDVFPVTDTNGAVTHYVGIFSDITEVKVQQKNLEHMAYHDPLTQLPNRTLFSDRLKSALQSVDVEKETLVICYFDLDGFKPVNDSLGHEAGDKLLVELAKRVRNALREQDTVARLGGDEFAILFNVQSKEACLNKLDQILALISQPYHIDGETLNQVSASIGYTLYPEDLSEPDTLLRHADHAMYYVKVHGRGFHYQFDSNVSKINGTQLQEKDAIKQALTNGELTLYYQPKVNMHLGTVSGAEALIRWNHPTRGLVPPSEFIPVIEKDIDATIALGEWVVDASLKQIEVWQKQGLDIKVSVNISPKHMVQANFAVRLEEILAQNETVSPKALELEITETAVIDDIEQVANTIKKCREIGISFALDDFGVGYSSLSYLRRLPVEAIKIDRSFVRDMLEDTDDLALVSSVISLGNSFGLDVVAEGVESAEHGVALMGLGCQYAQGYGISKPIMADDFSSWVKAYLPDPSWVHHKKISNL